MVISICISLIIVGLFMLVGGIGGSVRLGIPLLAVPGGLGGLLIVIGFLLYITGVCNVP